MEIKSINPKIKQSEIARELKISSSTLQRYRRELNAFGLKNTNIVKHSHKKTKHLKPYRGWPQNALKWPQTNQLKIRKIN